jgi:hypothetical protein
MREHGDTSSSQRPLGADEQHDSGWPEVHVLQVRKWDPGACGVVPRRRFHKRGPRASSSPCLESMQWLEGQQIEVTVTACEGAHFPGPLQTAGAVRRKTWFAPSVLNAFLIFANLSLKHLTGLQLRVYSRQ